MAGKEVVIVGCTGNSRDENAFNIITHDIQSPTTLDKIVEVAQANMTTVVFVQEDNRLTAYFGEFGSESENSISLDIPNPND